MRSIIRSPSRRKKQSANGALRPHCRATTARGRARAGAEPRLGLEGPYRQRFRHTVRLRRGAVGQRAVQTDLASTRFLGLGEGFGVAPHGRSGTDAALRRGRSRPPEERKGWDVMAYLTSLHVWPRADWIISSTCPSRRTRCGSRTIPHRGLGIRALPRRREGLVHWLSLRPRLRRLRRRSQREDDAPLVVLGLEPKAAPLAQEGTTRSAPL